MVVTVIGEYCLDTFIYCETKRLSPEAPVPVLNPIEIIHNKGMAGNVTENVRAMCKSCKVVEFYQTSEIKKTRYVEKKSNHMFIRVDENDYSDPFNLNISKSNAISNSDIVIVSDYNKGFLSNHDLLEIGKLAKLSILDSKKTLTNEIIKSFTFVKMNEKEFENNRHIIETKNIITTLGERGCLYKNKIYESPSPKETIDVSGAGDTFTSAFILKYYETRDEVKSIIFANEMSSIVVSKRGVTTP